MEKVENTKRLEICQRLFDALSVLEDVSEGVAHVAELLQLLEEFMTGEIDSLTSEPRLVKAFLERYPMAGALLRMIRDSIDSQMKPLEEATQEAYTAYFEMRDNAAGAGPAAAHGGKTAQGKAGK